MSRFNIPPIPKEHDGLVQAVREAGQATNIQAIANSFVWELSHKKFKAWSALVNFAVAASLPDHHFLQKSGYGRRCGVCGAYRDLNTFRQESFDIQRTNGHVNTYNLCFTYYDLLCFNNESFELPSDNDKFFFDELIKLIVHLPVTATTKIADASLKKLVPDAGDREILLGVFGICGIMATKKRPGFWPSFVNYIEYSDLDPGKYPYPVAYWTRENGVSLPALEHFGLKSFLSAKTIGDLESK